MAGNPLHCVLNQYLYKLGGGQSQVTNVQTSAGICPVVDITRNLCHLADGNDIGCNAIRECDDLTGATHGEYRLPGGPSGNVNMPILTVGQQLALATNSPQPISDKALQIVQAAQAAGGAVIPVGYFTPAATTVVNSNAAPAAQVAAASSNAPSQSVVGSGSGSSNAPMASIASFMSGMSTAELTMLVLGIAGVFLLPKLLGGR